MNLYYFIKIVLLDQVLSITQCLGQNQMISDQRDMQSRRRRRRKTQFPSFLDQVSSHSSHSKKEMGLIKMTHNRKQMAEKSKSTFNEISCVVYINSSFYSRKCTLGISQKPQTRRGGEIRN